MLHVLANSKAVRVELLSQAADALPTLESRAKLSERSEAFSIITDLPQGIGVRELCSVRRDPTDGSYHLRTITGHTVHVRDTLQILGDVPRRRVHA